MKETEKKLLKLSAAVDIVLLLVCYAVQIALIFICEAIGGWIPWAILVAVSFAICMFGGKQIGEGIVALLLSLVIGVLEAPFQLSRILRKEFVWDMVARLSVLEKLSKDELNQILGEMSYIRDWFSGLSTDDRANAAWNKIKPGGSEAKIVYGCRYYIEAASFCDMIEDIISSK